MVDIIWTWLQDGAHLAFLVGAVVLRWRGMTGWRPA